VEALEGRVLLAAPTVIDVMILYDANAKTQLGVNDAGMQRLIRQSLETANQVHYNTQDNVVLRLVHTQQVAYSSTGDIATDLNRLRTAGDGQLDNALTLRETHKADLVSLVTTPNFQGGLASLLDDVARPDRANLAFSVLSASALGPGDFVLAHELAHNMGGGHERGNTGDPAVGPFDYSYAHYFVGDNGVEYKDVMAYRNDTDALVLPYFSNPNLTHRGQPLGSAQANPDSADLYSTFLQTAPVVAAYRTGAVADAVAPAARLWQADVADNVVTFSVRYADDVAVNAATLDNRDVFVRTPEGFDLSAALVSVDRAGDGYAKVATYRVPLPPSRPGLTALQFHLRGGEVKDLSNNAAAGGVLTGSEFDIDGFEFQRARDTGAVVPGAARRLTGNVARGADRHDMIRFDVTEPTAVNVVLSGMTSESTMFLMQDVTGDDRFSGAGEQVTGTPVAGNAADKAMSAVLTPGTYYVLLQHEGAAGTSTDYALTLRAQSSATDATPPTAIADVRDLNPGTSNFEFSVIFADDNDLDAQSIEQLALIRLNFPGGSAIGTGSPDDVEVLADGRVVAHYSVGLSNAIPNGTVTLLMYDGSFGGSSSAVKDAAGNALANNAPLGTFRVGAADTTAPAVRGLTAAPVRVPGGTAYEFVVAYQDGRGVSAATLDNADVVVTRNGGGFSQAAQFVSATTSPRGSLTYARYRVTPPGGAWDYADKGTYTVSVQAGQVRDAANNAVAAGTAGTFTVNPPYPGDATGDGAVDFNDLVALAQSYDAFGGKGYKDGDFNFDGSVDFTDLVVLAQNYETVGAAAPVAAASAPVVSSATVAVMESVAGASATRAWLASQEQAAGAKKKPVEKKKVAAAAAASVFSTKPVAVKKAEAAKGRR
jgi:hypothetical protein